MYEDEHANGNISPQPHRWYRVQLPPNLVCELEYCAKRRRMTPEALLTSIGEVALREHLVTALLDDAR